MPSASVPNFKAKRVTRQYVQTIDAEPSIVHALICPVKEAEWLEGWDYNLIYSQSGVAEHGCVFTSQSAGEETIWLITKRDDVACETEFARVTPGSRVALVAIRIEDSGNHASRVHISYTITALTAAGNAFVDNFTHENFINDMQFWEASMNHYLKTGDALPQSDTQHWLNHRIRSKSMPISLLEQVRAGCKTVAEQATHIKIDVGRIRAYAAGLSVLGTTRPSHDPECHYLDQGEDTAAFFLTLDTINFGSGYFPHLRKHTGRSGYFTLADCLTTHFIQNGPFSARDLSRLTAADCTRIFAQDPENTPIFELMQLFARALNELGAYLMANFNGSFTGLITAAGASAERLMQLLVKMPCFNDVALWETVEVPFFKRAQLTAADLALAFNGKGPGRFEDLDDLTIFADNLVPHVLRVDNILRYPATLRTRIESGDLIAAGSKEEIEIRACALHAVELIKAALIESGQAINAMTLDFLLWNRGQQPAYKSIPRHRTRTYFY